MTLGGGSLDKVQMTVSVPCDSCYRWPQSQIVSWAVGGFRSSGSFRSPKFDCGASKWLGFCSVSLKAYGMGLITPYRKSIDTIFTNIPSGQSVVRAHMGVWSAGQQWVASSFQPAWHTCSYMADILDPDCQFHNNNMCQIRKCASRLTDYKKL